MTDRQREALDLARQILRDGSDLQWLEPLAREFVAALERESEAEEGR